MIQKYEFVEYYLKKYTDEDSIVLEIGCGCAQYKDSIRGKYIGLDITDKPYRDGLPRNVDIIASAEEIPLPDMSCSLVFAVGAFYQISDYDKAFMEVFRVLKKRGRFILFDYNCRTQKYLEIGEGQKRPCWTQKKLKALFEAYGFSDCEILLPKSKKYNFLFYKVYILFLEYIHGQWAIVTGIKK